MYVCKVHIRNIFGLENQDKDENKDEDKNMFMYVQYIFTKQSVCTYNTIHL